MIYDSHIKKLEALADLFREEVEALKKLQGKHGTPSVSTDGLYEKIAAKGRARRRTLLKEKTGGNQPPALITSKSESR